jgi:hypothetical protein
MVFNNRRQNPIQPHVLNERLGFVLNEKVDRIEMRINKVTQGKIYYSVPSANRYGRFGTENRQWKQTFTFTSSENKCKNLQTCHYLFL